MTSPRIETAKSLLEGFADLSEHRLVSTRSEDCTHAFAPSSLNMGPPRDNATFAAHLATLREVLSGFPVTPQEIFDSANENTVTVWATGDAIFHEELKDDGLSAEEWKYRGEYIFIFQMDSTGRRVQRIVEFLDSKATEHLRELMVRARGNRERLMGSKA